MNPLIAIYANGKCINAGTRRYPSCSVAVKMTILPWDTTAKITAKIISK